MYDFEQNKKNNLILYGVRGRSHENTDSLRRHLSDILRDHLNIRREVPIARATRIHTGPCLFECDFKGLSPGLSPGLCFVTCSSGPEVRGCRPVLVTFETFKDRETVFRQAKMLKKGANIDVTEDLSKRTRENRAELRKFMRKVLLRD